MSSSDVIKVDTEQHRILAKGYVTRSGVVNDTWNSVKLTLDGIVRRMPAYDGRLQKAVNEDVLDFSIRSRDFFNWFQDDSASLLKTAEAFEVVDGQTIKILEDCQGITSRASYIDQSGDTESVISSTKEVITNPDGSVTTITVVRIVNLDGSVNEIVTMETVWRLDDLDAHLWNDREREVAAIILGVSSSVLSAIAVSAFALSGGVALAIEIFTGLGITVLPESMKYESGDVVTKTVTIETNYPPPNNSPISEPPPSPEITSTTVVTDRNGDIKFEDTTGIESTGTLK
jgi:hypothetical protein